LALWGLASGVASMWLYAMISPQRRIAEGKRAQYAARLELDGFDGEFADAWPLIRRLLGSSLGQVRRVLMPAVLASLPVLCVLVWLSNAYGYQPPQRDTPIQVMPAELQERWQTTDSPQPQIEIHDSQGGLVTRVVLGAPVPTMEKRRWWNLLIGNPAGYLSSDGTVERLQPELPRRQHLPFGPDWMRGWELVFLFATVVASLVLKRWRGIH
jgi:hypothetical protein